MAKEKNKASNLMSLKQLIQRKQKRKETEKKSGHKKLSKKLGSKKPLAGEFFRTGISGFDSLMDRGIPKGISVLVAGGPGTGKTIFCLQLLANAAKAGKKVLYISFEESAERLLQHIEGFGWDISEHLKKNQVLIKRFNPFKLSRSVEAMLAKAKGELLIEMSSSDLFPRGFAPDIVIVDSITALASAFSESGETYRIYIEQLFRFFEKLGVTSFLISETEDAPHRLSETGVEEFLADGAIILYYVRDGNVKDRAIEILKMRGAKHEEKIVAMHITEKGIVIYPEQEIFSEVGK